MSLGLLILFNRTLQVVLEESINGEKSFSEKLEEKIDRERKILNQIEFIIRKITNISAIIYNENFLIESGKYLKLNKKKFIDEIEKKYASEYEKIRYDQEKREEIKINEEKEKEALNDAFKLLKDIEYYKESVFYLNPEENPDYLFEPRKLRKTEFQIEKNRDGSLKEENLMQRIKRIHQKRQKNDLEDKLILFREAARDMADEIRCIIEAQEFLIEACERRINIYNLFEEDKEKIIKGKEIKEIIRKKNDSGFSFNDSILSLKNETYDILGIGELKHKSDYIILGVEIEEYEEKTKFKNMKKYKKFKNMKKKIRGIKKMKNMKKLRKIIKNKKYKIFEVFPELIWEKNKLENMNFFELKVDYGRLIKKQSEE